MSSCPKGTKEFVVTFKGNVRKLGYYLFSRKIYDYAIHVSNMRVALKEVSLRLGVFVDGVDVKSSHLTFATNSDFVDDYV